MTGFIFGFIAGYIFLAVRDVVKAILKNAWIEYQKGKRK